jgi:predicted nucleotidyltransferase
VRVFGSVARGDDHENSDVDLLIDFEGGTSIFTVAGLARELGELLGVHVDIVSNHSMPSKTLQKARSEAVPL